jgi:rare lipoprotein A
VPNGIFATGSYVMRHNSSSKILVAILALFLAGCSHHDSGPKHHGFKSAKLDPFAGVGAPYYNKKGRIPFGGGKYHVGKPYQIAGRTYTPHEQPGYTKTGMASWYGDAFHRRKTSNGEWFDMETMTAAHPTLPLPSYAKVTNLENGRSVIVRVNDRGPFVDTRIMDLSKRAADKLGYRNKGIAKVKVQLIGPAPLRDSNAHMMAMNDAVDNGASLNQIAAMAQGDDSVQVAEVSPRKMRSQPLPESQVAFDEPAPSPTGYMVRVALFHDRANANAAYQALAEYGPTQIVKAVGANGPLYRVEIGPIDSEQDAQVALSNAVSSGYGDARIVATQAVQVSSN